jgi:hypothetical protein
MRRSAKAEVGDERRIRLLRVGLKTLRREVVEPTGRGPAVTRRQAQLSA